MSLELRGIHKRFGQVRANDGIDLTVEAGTLHGLLGENGAGKSTLMKILSGFVRADSGEIRLDGKSVEISSPKEATRAGIGMLHQDPLIFLPFTVLDNFLLGSPGRGRIDRAEGSRELRRMSERFGFSLDPNAIVRNLTVGERQQLEIVRLLDLGVRVLILDEPTTGISATHRQKLFETLRILTSEGLIMGVIFVSHKLEEVEELCGKVSVMRQGRLVGEAELPCPTDRLVEMMFGKVFAESERRAVQHGEVVLELEHVTITERTTSIEDLTLSIRAGEVVGLAGLEGSGQGTFIRACAGLLRPESGRVSIDGRSVPRGNYRGFRAAGVHYLPAGRLEEGLIQGVTITEHFVLAGGADRFVVDWAEARDAAQEKIEANSIKGTPSSNADQLSGGNQQRLLLAMTPPSPRLLLMEHPTRGLDLESADWVWQQLLARRDQGTAIVFASADLDELLRYGDRILVFFAGDVLKVLIAGETTGEELGYLIGGKELV